MDRLVSKRRANAASSRSSRRAACALAAGALLLACLQTPLAAQSATQPTADDAQPAATQPNVVQIRVQVPGPDGRPVNTTAVVDMGPRSSDDPPAVAEASPNQPVAQSQPASTPSGPPAVEIMTTDGPVAAVLLDFHHADGPTVRRPDGSEQKLPPETIGWTVLPDSRPLPPRADALHLRNGDRLYGDILSIDARHIHIQITPKDALKLDRALAAGAVFAHARGRSAYSELSAIAEIGSASALDEIHLENEDIASGAVRSARLSREPAAVRSAQPAASDPDQPRRTTVRPRGVPAPPPARSRGDVEFLPPNADNPIKLPLERMLAVAFAAPDNPPPESQTPVWLVYLTNGCILRAHQLSSRNNLLQLSLHGQQLTAPWDQVLRIESPPTMTAAAEQRRFFWLSEMQTAKSEHRPFISGVRLPRRDRAIHGTEMRVHGRSYPRGWGMTSGSTLAFRVPRDARRLVGAIAIDDAASQYADVEVTVLVDAQPVVEAHALTPTTPVLRLDIPVENARRIEFRIDYGLYGQTSDFVNLVDAAFVK